MKFEVEKLYKCTSHYLLIYPLKEKARATVLATWAATTSADYWSKRLNCKVHYSQLNEPFMVLKESEIIEGLRYINVLFGDKIGWIIYNEEWEWLKIERLSP